MIWRLFRPVTLFLAVILLTQASCATTALWFAGAAYNASTPETKSVAPSRAAQLGTGSRITMLLRDSTVVTGTLAMSRDATDDELGAIYRDVAASGPAGLRLPLPGDTILVSMERMRSWARFCRLMNTGPGATAEFVSEPGAVVQVQLAAGAVPITVPLTEVRSLQWADSTTLVGADLVRLSVGCVPSQPRLISVQTEPGTTVAIHSWEVERVEVYPWRNAVVKGVGIGLLLDSAFWAYFAAHPPVIM